MFHRFFLVLATGIMLAGCGTRRPDFAGASPEKRKQLEDAVSSHLRLAATLDRCRGAPVEIFEGLPHPSFERPAFASESRRADTFVNHDFRFYKPAMILPGTARGRLLNQAHHTSTYLPWRGPRYCGGFHPDVLLRYTTETGPVDLHLCFGCGEARFFDGSAMIRMDINESVLDGLEKLYRTHRDKRPATKRPR